MVWSLQTLYIIVNEQDYSIVDGWKPHLRFTFIRSVDQNIMNKWYYLLSVAESLQSEDDDAIIWMHESKGFVL
jgi:hypothetical protein